MSLEFGTTVKFKISAKLTFGDDHEYILVSMNRSSASLVEKIETENSDEYFAFSLRNVPVDSIEEA